ncbi:MAG: DUF4190 domain-containing protein [Anaerolineaceae bacterium]|nr:DUF4190 domain-containing protein [Anaerolineaceae bacterium]MBN2678447.1 DUF4190 domain-containing protein [Anaerolineaceae bacterium]
MTVDSLPPIVETPANDKPGLGIASLILGIVSMCGSGLPYVNYCLGLTCLAGIVTGILGLKSSKKGLAIAGLILSILSICALTASIIFWTGVGTALLQDPSQWQDFLNQLNY